ncbi:hypothetical protein GQX73_g4107 [Xylaria multiplex]|uniref:Uncharacterized protein n=1 Tax=Xylaria multiplex TaxID=323545 RepID=A0A7C8ISW7_9PEZI|nr:hypothetical protein GQX73_g4107 [Xylaria multiplex]
MERLMVDGEAYWKRIPGWSNVSEGDFINYRWQLDNSIKNSQQLFKFLRSVLPQSLPSSHGDKQSPATADGLIDDIQSGMQQATMAISITPQILSLVDWSDPLHDPLMRQFVPLRSRMQPDHPLLTLDSLDETGDSPVKGIIHRYPDRAVFLGSNTKIVNKIRFLPIEKKWEVMFNYIERTETLSDILVSGGDIYTLSPEQIRSIGMRLLHIPHILKIRIATKGLAVCPSRLIDPTDEWAGTVIDLSNQGRKMGKSVAIHTHFNHPREITWITRKAARKLFEEGVTVRNQTVLLNGVNNDVATMMSLIKHLSAINIQPYYVFQCDMVKGVEDMRTPLHEILTLESVIRGSTTGFMTPNFVVNLPGGGGKRLACSDATIDDLASLQHTPDTIPPTVWLIAFTGAAQRFAFYGITVPWQNYLQNPPGNPLSPGALGLGQSTATTINNAFLFFSYLATILFAVASDSWLGRYKTLLISLMMINIAALSTLATTSLEKRIGFWAAYLLPLAFMSVSIVPFVLWNQSFTKLPAQSSVLAHAVKIVIAAFQSGFHLSAADPAYQQSCKGRSVPWTSNFVQELRRGFRACRVLLFFIIFYLCFNQSTNNIIAQANQMELSGVSNDTVQSLNAIFYIFLNPIVSFWVLPLFARRQVPLGPITRMTAAFVLLALAMGYAAGVQELIYKRGPCFTHPLACEAGQFTTSDGQVRHRPNEISVWVQTPFYFLVAASEIFGFVAENEFTYLEAPENMKALVKAFEQLTAALGALLGIALGPVSRDPWLVILYSALAGTMAVAGVILFGIFRKYDARWYLSRGLEEPEKSSNTEFGMVPEDPK